MRRSVIGLGVALALALVACPGSGDVDAAPQGTLVVGIQSDELGPLGASVHVVVRREGIVVHDETLPLLGSANPLPKEIEVAGPVGAVIDVIAEVLTPSPGPPIVTRRGASRLVATGKKLLRLNLESRCLLLPGAPVGACTAPLTCIGGTCASGDVAPSALEDYDPTWSLAAPDVCRPAKHGAPEVHIGTGQSDWADLEDGQVLKLEKGPQGGHHIWIAARMKNLRQSGTTTAIRAVLVGDPSPVPPTAFVFSFVPDEGAYCKVWGLRYQVDAGAPDLADGYKRFLGKMLEVTIEVHDTTNATATSTKTIQLADKLLCPDGTESCNVP